MVRIKLNTTGPSEVLHLEEVQLFSAQGTQLPASSLNFSMSSEGSANTSAAKWAPRAPSTPAALLRCRLPRATSDRPQSYKAPAHADPPPPLQLQ
jgi:hypothetical protein